MYENKLKNKFYYSKKLEKISKKIINIYSPTSCDLCPLGHYQDDEGLKFQRIFIIVKKS